MYHGLVALHARMPLVFVALGMISLALAVIRFAGIQHQLRELRRFEVAPPQRVREAALTGISSIAYIRAPQKFCFTTILGPQVLISSGLETSLTNEQLVMVLEHEREHIRRGDPLRALLWHLLFAALILPGFGLLERALHTARERRVDKRVAMVSAHPSQYETLKEALARRKDSPDDAIWSGSLGGRPSHAWRPALIALVPLSVLVLLSFSHEWFIQAQPFLIQHHC